MGRTLFLANLGVHTPGYDFAVVGEPAALEALYVVHHGPGPGGTFRLNSHRSAEGDPPIVLHPPSLSTD